MTKQEFIHRACDYAIFEMIRKGSSSFATKIDGKFIMKDWAEILDELNNIFEEEKKND